MVQIRWLTKMSDEKLYKITRDNGGKSSMGDVSSDMDTYRDSSMNLLQNKHVEKQNKNRNYKTDRAHEIDRESE